MKYNIDIDNMPILGCLDRYSGENPVRFHMPGHKAANIAKKYFGKAAKYDITELSFSDNLLKAEGIISRAENLCAESYGAEAVKFCTCGSTIALHALIHSLKKTGSSIIIERNSHKSVYSALKLCAIEPVICDNAYDEIKKMYIHVTAEDVERALKENPSAIGALITSPDYYGNIPNLQGISKVLKERGKLLLIDAAHGGHLPYIYKGIYNFCDAFICSPHKTMLSLTQGSYAVFNNFKLYEGYLRSFDLFHTSSPSYPILASLDFSREFMQKNGAKCLQNLKKIIDNCVNTLESYGYICLNGGDYTRLVISSEKKSCTGFEIASYLEDRGIYCEMSDEYHIVVLLSVADTDEKGLKRLCKELKGYRASNIISCARKQCFIAPQNRKMGYTVAANAPSERVALSEAAGRISACEAGLYPPAYPVICCGDEISQEAVNYLLANIDHTFGVDNDTVFVVK